MSACLSTSIEIYMPYTHASSCIISPKRFDSVQHTAHQTLSLEPRAISVKFRILQKDRHGNFRQFIEQYVHEYEGTVMM